MSLKTYHSLDQVPPAQRSVAVGTFDGVHIGHQAVIAEAQEWAARHATRATVVTFDPHPRAVLAPERAPDLITPLAIKVDAVAALGCEELVVIRFDREFSRLEPDDFCRDVLAGQLGAAHVSVGANFHFGRGAEGTAESMAARGPEFGFEAKVVGLVEYGGEPVSSSRIRSLVREGAVDVAAQLLGRSLELEGTVVEGDRRGSRIGFPTANILPVQGELVPGQGVYAAVDRDGRPAAVSVGTRPTFEVAGRVVVEAHLLDVGEQLYGRRLRLAFLKRLRGEERFESVEALVAQMRRDVQEVRAIMGARARRQSAAERLC